MDPEIRFLASVLKRHMYPEAVLRMSGSGFALDQSFVLDAPKFLFEFSPPSHLNFGKISRNSGCNDVANAISNCSKSDARADGAQISRNSSIFQDISLSETNRFEILAQLLDKFPASDGAPKFRKEFRETLV